MKFFRRLPLIVVALAMCVGCGSVSKTGYTALTGLKGAYNGANDVRSAYCAPKPQPKPQICTDSYKPMVAVYHVLLEGSRLLETYIVSKDAGVSAQLTALAAETPRLILEVTEIAGQFKAASGASPPAAAPAAPTR